LAGVEAARWAHCLGLGRGDADVCGSRVHSAFRSQGNYFSQPCLCDDAGDTAAWRKSGPGPLDGSIDCDAWGAYFAAANGYKLSACRILILSAAIFLGAELIFIRRLTGGEAPLQILLINNLSGILISTLAVAFVWRASSLL
tara:strand:+ start:132 stop:557 length:426 start_codon:yes stop_codon:yes gene_type:complete